MVNKHAWDGVLVKAPLIGSPRAEATKPQNPSRTGMLFHRIPEVLFFNIFYNDINFGKKSKFIRGPFAMPWGLQRLHLGPTVWPVWKTHGETAPGNDGFSWVFHIELLVDRRETWTWTCWRSRVCPFEPYFGVTPDADFAHSLLVYSRLCFASHISSIWVLTSLRALGLVNAIPLVLNTPHMRPPSHE